MIRGKTLARRLAIRISLSFAGIWILAVISMATMLRLEQSEMLDLELRETANLFLPFFTAEIERSGGAAPSADIVPRKHENAKAEEDLAYALIGPDGDMILRSRNVADVQFPTGPPREGYQTTKTHVFYMTATNDQGYLLWFGDPLVERREAYLESFLAFLVPMAAILPLGFLLIGWSARSGLAPLQHLRTEINARDEGRLDPIDKTGLPLELSSTITTLNGLMFRLSQALEGERTFATNAAHELRTPVAVALAQVQRLRAGLKEASQREQIAEVEQALKRMSGLVSRLLELARAQAGIGLAEEPRDIVELLRHVLDSYQRDETRASLLKVDLPENPVMRRIDPDAFAIVVGNLVENAFRHRLEDDTPVKIEISDDRVLYVRNAARHFKPQELERFMERFSKSESDDRGYGLGLYISRLIARQSGGDLRLCCINHPTCTEFEAAFSFAGEKLTS